ncbi:MAG: sugar ABC transporter permease [Bauldia sp.]|nr:sugar ABC transporter permease [Bauldia sp.]
MTAAAATARDTVPRPGLAERFDRHAGRLMVLPAVIVILCFAIFPLIISAYLSLTRFALAPGGFTLKYVGNFNYKKLLFGSQQYHLLGTFKEFGPVEWIIVAAMAALILFLLGRYFMSGRATIFGTIGRLITASLTMGLTLLATATIVAGGVPGTMVTTLIYVVVGVTAQFLLGLGLAMLCAQAIRGRNFFRVLFFVPLMVTPVGIAYTFRMLADIQKGPFAPLLQSLGVTQWSWATDAWSARLMVLVGDTWQWTPFMFIVLLAAIENQPRDQVEAARIDGANGFQIFRDITWPAIAPVAATIVLIRLIEAFKIVDLPNVLTGGGPGLATESMTLHSFIAWRTQDLGGSAAVGYMLLFVSTIVCVSFFNFMVRPARRLES